MIVSPTATKVWQGVGGIPHGAEEMAATSKEAAGAITPDGTPDGERLFAATARPRKAAGQPFRFAVAGDIGAGSPDQRGVAAALSGRGLDFVAVPGDFMYSHGRVAEYWATEFFAIYGAETADPQVLLTQSLPGMLPTVRAQGARCDWGVKEMAPGCTDSSHSAGCLVGWRAVAPVGPDLRWAGPT